METPQEPEKKPIKTGKQNLYIGLIVGAIIGVFISHYTLEVLPWGYEYALVILALIFAIVVSVFLVIVHYREQIFKFLFGESRDLDSFRSNAQGLTKATAVAISDRLAKGLPEEDQENFRQVAPDLANYIIWGRIRRWWLGWLLLILGSIGGLVTIILTVNQNQLLEAQNKKIDMQTQLMESERRSSLIFMMSNILDKVDYEIKEQNWKIEAFKSLDNPWVGLPDSLRYNLSTPLIGRVVALSRAFQPYYRLQDTVLSKRVSSPERGQLFIALMQNKLDSATQSAIAINGNFSFAVIRQIRLDNAKFQHISLSHADLSGASLASAFLKCADLSESTLQHTVFVGANLIRANLKGADLKGALLGRTKLMEANLEGANLEDVIFNGADLTMANLKNAKGLSYRELMRAESLDRVIGLPATLEDSLRTAKKSLFERTGYKKSFGGCPISIN